MTIRTIDHVQFAMPPGPEAEPLEGCRHLFTGDPAGSPIELVQPR